MSTTSSRKGIFHTSFVSADPISSMYTNEPCYWPALNCHLSLACRIFNNNKNKPFCSTYSVLGSILGTLKILTYSYLFIWLCQVFSCACRILFPEQGSNPSALRARVLVTRPPVVVQWLGRVLLFMKPWTTARSSVLHCLPEFVQIHVH